MMAQGITMGAPLFGSSSDFVKTMEGQGLLGPMLTLLGMKPVKFQSESDFAKSISTESKVFSIYAVGAVKGYKRETRVSIHTVVDFRQTQPLTTASGAPAAASSTATPTTPPVGGAGGQQIPLSGSAISTALQPAVGGQTIYFNIQ
jgi:general secretion pathway protein K